MFKLRFPNIEETHIPDQKGNYRITLRTNDDALKMIKWKPKDKLAKYIKSLK